MQKTAPAGTASTEDLQPLHELATLHGIEVRYDDALGNAREVPALTLKAILTSFGIAAESHDDITASLTAARESPWSKLIDDVIVLSTTSRSWSCIISLPLGAIALSTVTIRGVIQGEGRQRRSFSYAGSALKVVQSTSLKGVRYVKARLPLPKKLPLGYYTLSVIVRGLASHVDGRSLVIVAPPRCYELPRQKKVWGVTAQLYGLRTRRNWGIGDFEDLRNLATWAGKHLGAAMIGLNPLHTLTSGLISPYSPSSRLFHAPLYLDVTGIDEYRDTPSVKRAVRAPAFQAKLSALRSADTVDYHEVVKVKWPVFEKLFRSFSRRHLRLRTTRGRAFERFCREGGNALHLFAVFQALAEHFGGAGWSQWPEDYQDPAHPAVRRFARRHRKRVQFYQYLEWECDRQLRRLDNATARAGMPLGLYHDLAIGVHPDGADAWIFQDQFIHGMAVGAPPDPFNLRGQNWGLLPLCPKTLRAHGYRVFRDTLRSAMRHGGLLRIDHALGLFRLFWIPAGSSGTDGAYVRYRTDELLAILAVESHRNRVVVIGEDLGTVTPEIHRTLADGGLLSYRLLMFEKQADGRFFEPTAFPAQAIVSFNTHDLPTLQGFWEGRDIAIKEKLGMYPSPIDVQRDWRARAQDCRQLLDAFWKEKLLPRTFPVDGHLGPSEKQQLCQALYAYLARTSCQVVAISLEDLLGEMDTPNIPGAPWGSYPVWQRKLSRDFEDWQRNPFVKEMALMFHREGRSRPGM